MSLILNDSDFQCLQDQIIDLKAKNYELAEKNRRSLADFEAAKAKICNLQLKLEEQERDFEVTSTTLRREIEAVSSVAESKEKENSKEEDYRAKYKKLLHKAKEINSRYDKAVEIIQRLDTKKQVFSQKLEQLEEEYTTKCNDWKSTWSKCTQTWNEAIEKYKNLYEMGIKEYESKLIDISSERDHLQEEVSRLASEINNFDNRLESEAEERKIHERKCLQMVKELKRQLALEQTRNETLRKRLETFLLNNTIGSSSTSELNKSPKGHLSNSSSTNGNSSGKATNHDTNSVGSWSFVKTKSSNTGLNETLSLCSIDSEDRETVHQTCDTVLPEMESTNHNNNDQAKQQRRQQQLSLPSTPTKSCNFHLNKTDRHPSSSSDGAGSGMLLEEQAALMERLTQLQHDKWQLEEKLSYLEQANFSLTEDLANKSDLIRRHFMEQANKKASNPLSFNSSNNSNFTINNSPATSTFRRSSLTSNINNIISDKPGLKKMVDFIKEKSHLPDSESLSKEATKRMQLMLEETLIKNLKLQENLDYVTSELNKLKC